MMMKPMNSLILLVLLQAGFAIAAPSAKTSNQHVTTARQNQASQETQTQNIDTYASLCKGWGVREIRDLAKLVPVAPESPTQLAVDRHQSLVEAKSGWGASMKNDIDGMLISRLNLSSIGVPKSTFPRMVYARDINGQLTTLHFETENEVLITNLNPTRRGQSCRLKFYGPGESSPGGIFSRVGSTQVLIVESRNSVAPTTNLTCVCNIKSQTLVSTGSASVQCSSAADLCTHELGATLRNSPVIRFKAVCGRNKSELFTEVTGSLDASDSMICQRK